METSRKGIGGPKTLEGKLKVSLNALKTGLYASSEQAIEVLEQTIGSSYSELLERMQEYYEPQDPLEEILVRRIARLAWRMKLTEAIETRNLMRCPDHPHIGAQYERIIRSERVIDVQFHRAVFALERKRRREFENSQNKLIPPPIHEGIQP